MKIKFWGTRGSLPVTLTHADYLDRVKEILLDARNSDIRNENEIDNFFDSSSDGMPLMLGGNTSCVEVVSGDERLILDCGSGIAALGRELMNGSFPGPQIINILQSHTHWDHIMGFPFFQPAYTRGTVINIYGGHSGLEERFADQMDGIHFPITLSDLNASVFFHQLKPHEETSIGGFRIRIKPLIHPGGAWAYRIESRGKTLVYATDGEYTDSGDVGLKPYTDFYSDADVLIFDAMYADMEQSAEKKNFGHSTGYIGAKLTAASGAGRLVIFHHNFETPDNEIIQAFRKTREFLEDMNCQNSRCQAVLSFDGLEIEI